jgi:hypothetical protein
VKIVRLHDLDDARAELQAAQAQHVAARRRLRWARVKLAAACFVLGGAIYLLISEVLR